MYTTMDALSRQPTPRNVQSNERTGLCVTYRHERCGTVKASRKAKKNTTRPAGFSNTLRSSPM